MKTIEIDGEEYEIVGNLIKGISAPLAEVDNYRLLKKVEKPKKSPLQEMIDETLDTIREEVACRMTANWLVSEMEKFVDDRSQREIDYSFGVSAAIEEAKRLIGRK